MESTEKRSDTALEQADASKVVDSQQESKAAFDNAETHVEAAEAANKVAYKVFLDPSVDTESEMREAAAEMRKSIKTARDEIAAAMVAIKMLPDSAGKRDYQRALDAMLDAALRLEGLSTLYDNQDGITTSILATGGEVMLMNEMSALGASYETAMKNADAIRRSVLRELSNDEATSSD